jgi:hypothetical protein
MLLPGFLLIKFCEPANEEPIREKKYKKPLSILADSIYVIKPAGLSFPRRGALVCPEA